jgi:hypothetical protein
MIETPASASTPGGEPRPAYTEMTLTPNQVNGLGLPLSLGLLVVCLIPFALRWGPRALFAGLDDLGWWLVPVIVLGVVAHELLHGLGWKLAAGLPWSQIKFGVQWKYLMAYAHARVPMRVGPYRLGAALPGLVLGAVPVAAAVALGHSVLLWVGAFFVIAAVGDLMILWLLRRLPRTAQVLDHPTLPGCLVLNEPSG